MTLSERIDDFLARYRRETDMVDVHEAADLFEELKGIMNTAEYEQWVEENCLRYTDANYCVVALNEEAGEIAGWWKKHQLRGNPGGTLTIQDLKGELGDTLFYLTRLAMHYGWTLEEIMSYNRKKIDARKQETGSVVG